MKRTFRKLTAMLLTAAMAASLVPAATVTAAEPEPVNVPLQTVYSKPASNWETEAMPLGNGFLGAMVFGGINADEILINEHTLWSGGPGSDANYDGGMSNATQEQNWSKLQYARTELAKIMSDFTANDSAYKDENGKIITKNYPNLPSALNNAINSLKGEKNHFGAYQEMGSIKIYEGVQSVLMSATATNCKVTDARNLFDGNINSKWFSSDGGKWDDDSTRFPLDIIAVYSSEKTIRGYTLTSGNDDYGRDPNACKLAQADGFIREFPDQYDTMLEQGGANVSGGQRQRLCIARALLKKPKILILDDSTSAVDTKTDALIRQAFAQEIPNTTKLIIAQRISSVQDADKIIVLADGKIDGFGTHDELMKTNTIYREVYESQNRKEVG